MALIESHNPATGELVESFAPLGDDDIARSLTLAQTAGLAWRETPIEHRSGLMRRLATELRTRKSAHALLMAREMGKPVTEGEAEAEKCAWVCEYYAEHAASMLASEPVATDAARSYVRHDPLGTILAVMPWNFPYWQVFRFAAPAMMAGNTALLKHASNVPRCALGIEEMFRTAGFPAGLFQTLLISARQVELVLSSPVVRAATLTGSEAAGSAVAAAAGRRLKKTVLELGGSDPFIVLDDADPLHAAEWAARGRTVNTGQSCIAAKRFIVADSIADAFVAALSRELEKLPLGDPADRSVRLGPLARPDLVDDLDRQVKASIERGALLVTGGYRPDRPGWYYAPTLLDRVRPGMAAFDEETFGPLAAVIRATSDEEALELANASRYGLGASIWSRTPERAERLVSRVEAGCVFVNGIVKSDPRLPFGGVKMSGYGRELSYHGLREFVNTKAVWIGT